MARTRPRGGLTEALARGRERERFADLPGARRDYGAALRLARDREDKAKALFRRFVVRAKMGDHRAAVRDLNAARALDQSCHWLGSASGGEGLPVWSLDHAVSRYPEDAWFYAWRADARVRQRLPGAVDDLRRAAARGLRSGWPKALLARLEKDGAEPGGEPPASAPPDEIRAASEHLWSMAMLQDFLAVVHGLRPAAFYYDLPQTTLDALEVLCAKEGLRWGAYRDPRTGDRRTVWTRDPALLARLLASGGRGGGGIPGGAGYPACCRAFDAEVISRYPDLRERPPYPALTERGGAAPGFAMNYLYHLESRDWGKRGLKGWRSDYNRFHLLPWTPCSFSCGPSRRYALKMLALLRKRLPPEAARLEALLKRPILLFSDFEFASLEGKRDGSGARYRGFIDPAGLLPGDVKTALSAADRVEADGQRAVLFKAGRRTAELRRPAQLFFFLDKP